MKRLVALCLPFLLSIASGAEGFFRVEQREGKWLVLDPDGNSVDLFCEL